MAKVSFDVAEQLSSQQNDGVGFFNLKNDGESAIEAVKKQKEVK